MSPISILGHASFFLLSAVAIIPMIRTCWNLTHSHLQCHQVLPSGTFIISVPFSQPFFLPHIPTIYGFFFFFTFLNTRTSIITSFKNLTHMLVEAYLGLYKHLNLNVFKYCLSSILLILSSDILIT